jgi:mono/diheme cytochrome c family protein
MSARWLVCAGFLLTAAVLCTAEAPWVHHLSRADWEKTNPYASQAEAIAAGSRLFGDYCAKCHGEDALGRKKRPNLRSQEVQTAADAELFWMLKNGNLRRGMPSWSSLPEAQRWQIITYIKSLGEWSGNSSADKRHGRAH